MHLLHEHSTGDAHADVHGLRFCNSNTVVVYRVREVAPCNHE
jgi:hypothetical protein